MEEISVDDNIMVGESDFWVCECAKLSKFLNEEIICEYEILLCFAIPLRLLY